jgi:Transglycosylase SLT domain
MGHHFNQERQNGDNQEFGRSQHQFGLHIELGDQQSYQQSMGPHYANMNRIHGHFHQQQSLPNMEIYGGNEAPQGYYRPGQGNDYAQPNYYSQPNYGQDQSSYQQQNQPQHLDFDNPYHQHEHHRPHHPLHPRHGHHPHHQSGQEQYGDQNYGNQSGDGIGPGHRSVYTYDGAVRANPEQAMESARVVAQVARKMGVDPVVAVAAMLVESGGNPHAVGDHGHSFGLFQLNANGELKAAHLSPEQAFNPETNAEVALSYFRRGHCGNPGEMAAAAQRPANRADYARKVNSNLAEAERMVQQMGLA